MSWDDGRYAEYEPEGGGWGTVARVVGTIALIVVLFGGAYWGVRRLAGAVGEAISPSDETRVAAGLEVEVDIPIGSSAGDIAAILFDAGVVESAADFERAVRAQRATDRLQAGTFSLVTGMDEGEVIAALIEGPPEVDIFRITVIEGLRVEQMVASVARQTGFSEEELTEALLDGSVTSELLPGEPVAVRDWEGLLFPDTYEITDEFTAVEVLQLLASTAERRVESVDWSRLEEAGYSPYEGVIIASLIEREVRVDEERPLVASVIMNRLEMGMRLQIDATVVYALGGGVSEVTFEDLEVDSPYNTYRVEGLPPTPISGVRLDSLVAAADWADTDFLFYVLADEDGSHAFAETLAEHEENVARSREAGIIP